jgi:hypothetical protein
VRAPGAAVEQQYRLDRAHLRGDQSAGLS